MCPDQDENAENYVKDFDPKSTVMVIANWVSCAGWELPGISLLDTHLDFCEWWIFGSAESPSNKN